MPSITLPLLSAVWTWEYDGMSLLWFYYTVCYKGFADVVKVLNHLTLASSKGQLSLWAWPNQMGPSIEAKALQRRSPVGLEKEQIVMLWRSLQEKDVRANSGCWAWFTVNSWLKMGGRGILSHTTMRKQIRQQLEWTWKRPLSCKLGFSQSAPRFQPSKTPSKGPS